ncbi:MAG: tetratricopeptide repeat protein [Gemmatimonadaceae bacterium]|nr:tetratricopeptide repeat protein [Gemmatimonadaceae bacterium]
MTSPGDTLHTARAALDAARVVFSPEAMTASTAPSLWQAAQVVLQRVLGRHELSGHALVGEARRLGVLTLSDAHALVGLASWADRSNTPAVNEAERILLREAWMALEHAVPDSAPAIDTSRPASSASASASSAYAPPPASARPTFSPEPVLRDSAPGSSDTASQVSALRRVPMAAWATLALLIVASGVFGTWYWRGRADRAFAAAVSAYRGGNVTLARTAMADMARDFPTDARPLVYLGRLSREDGDLPRARRLLTAAVELAPNSSIASRELASLMLAEGQPEIARRFYVRALQSAPEDRVAQGFLACALHRLQRFDEARRWYERAGPGEWQGCLAAPPFPGVPPGAIPVPPAS